MSESEPFGFEVSRPGGGNRPNYVQDSEWVLYLPHQCGEWIITGTTDWHEAMREARRFRDELDAAIAALYEAAPND